MSVIKRWGMDYFTSSSGTSSTTPAAKGIPVGPGRGLRRREHRRLLYVVSPHRPPIKYNLLLFERFEPGTGQHVPTLTSISATSAARKSSTMWWPSMGATMWLRSSTFGTIGGQRIWCGMWAGLRASVTSRWTPLPN